MGREECRAVRSGESGAVMGDVGKVQRARVGGEGEARRAREGRRWESGRGGRNGRRQVTLRVGQRVGPVMKGDVRSRVAVGGCEERRERER